MKILKFGGTSVASAENIQKVISILKAESATDQVLAVVSAMGGVTDTLQRTGELAQQKEMAYLRLFESLTERHLQTAEELKLPTTAIAEVKGQLDNLKQILQGIYLINEFSEKTRDKVLSFGELLSSFIISEAIKVDFESAVLKDSRELILTDNSYTRAQVYAENTGKKIRAFFNEHESMITILPGFVSRSMDGETTTLGRGGSDYTAAILAASLRAERLEIWTDVSGMYTANPKLVKQAFPLKEISYEEAMELSHFGAKVLYPPTITPVLKKDIPIVIKNTFQPEAPGTLIKRTVENSRGPVKGISHLPGIALLTLEGSGMVGIPGFSKRLFEALTLKEVNVVLITQASSEHSICVAVQQSDLDAATEAVNKEFEYEISLAKIRPAFVEQDLAIIALVGENMKSHQGISGKMFSALGENNVNIRAIAQGASERNISAVILEKDVKKALTALHSRFFEKQLRNINVFIVGVGNVGKRLLDQLHRQHQYLLDELMIRVKVAGISNSRKMIFDSEGIDLENWQQLLNEGETRTDETWFARIQQLNLVNSVFVDVTASQEIAESYAQYLKESIAIVACNKIACSSDFANYKVLKSLSKKYNAPFFFETNVGAGLPVINTLSNLINSGDRITRIQAVLSGSLNFVFNNFKTDSSFFEIVSQAQKEGYTEPDPRIDLSGVDVARKILILARESGYELNIDDIENISFLPQESLEADSVEDFFETLKTNASHFETLIQKAEANSCQLKYVAEFNQGKAKVSLQEIPATHPFYNLEGKDNIVLFFTERYVEQPLIIKGAGAGADVTASGLFGDIIRLGKS